MTENKNKISGFTLTETMVVVLIFAAVMSLALAVFLSTVRNQRVAMSYQRLVAETSYALGEAEEMLRKEGSVNQTDINKFLSSSVEIVDFSAYTENGEKTTISLKTKIKVGEGEDLSIRLQTTTVTN